MPDYPDDLDEFLKHAKAETLPKMKSSVMSLVLLHSDPDPKICLEVGAAILFDKPIIVMVRKGQKVPANLKRVASKIVEGDESNPMMDIAEQIREAMKSVLENDVRTKPQ